MPTTDGFLLIKSEQDDPQWSAEWIFLLQPLQVWVELARIASKGAERIVPAGQTGMGFDPSLPKTQEDELLEDELLPQELDVESKL